MIERERGYDKRPLSTPAETEDCYQLVTRSNAPDALTLIMRNGNCWFANYTSLESGLLSGEIMKLTFAEEIAIIHGENLDPIRQALTTRRVTYLREIPERKAQNDKPHITKIHISKRS